ncbi:HAMP domain-containing sensor histidine kinase [Paenibacillus sp. M1]|uniref:histidine kinase n=1 Tax=Paenibacillus haidiansis TaxID=1574488 RepID=A0ABU7VPD0_9BACL
MRTLRIRKFTLLCLLFILSVPWIFYVAAHFIETGTLSLGKSRTQNAHLQQELTETVQMIEAGSAEWNDPTWRNRLQTQLRKTEMEAIILNASGQEIFRSDSQRGGVGASIERFSILENGSLIGKVVIYLPNSRTVPMISAFAGLLLAIFIIAMEMRRFLLKPLEKMSLAARQIAAGDWEVRLPLSRIAEIAEVRDGFEVMMKGLQRSHRKQAELEEERRFVIAAVAHDLRTPLFALRGYLDGLSQGIAQSPEQIAKYVAVCKEKSAQLDRLVEDLFTFTKLEYVETKPDYKTVDLKLILQKSIESLSPQARLKHISISLRSAGDCIVGGDPHLLERAMNNLLDNAVRHTPADGEIEIQCFTEDSKVMFTVRDTGLGFSPDEQARVFEPLYRGEVSRNRSTGGSGLGLTISQKIVRGHGGELAAGNQPEGGALLTGWVPAARSDG